MNVLRITKERYDVILPSNIKESELLTQNDKKVLGGILHYFAVLDKAKENGYVTTIFGRRRYLPGVRSDNWGVKSFAERCALNTPIQGTAADILKLAINRIMCGLPERVWLKPILQIHDELTFIIPKEKLSEAVNFIKECMEEQPFPEFDLPLVAEASAGETFGTMEELEDV